MSEELAEYGATDHADCAAGSEAGMSPAEARRRGGDDAEPCRVRHARLGLYLEATVWRPGLVMPESPRDITLRWRPVRAAGTAMPRAMAAKTAAVYIALTGDHDVEIEEVEA